MNRVRERASNTLEHLEMSKLGRLARRAVPERKVEDDDDDENSSLPLFFWGALTALALWWLYLRPVTTERRLRKLRTGRRPGPRAGSRPASARPPQYREPAQTITPAAEMDEVEEDDLTLIFGIGPARFARLREAGITTFAALAIADAEQLRDILAGVGVGTPDIETWPEQASLAAKGNWEAFEAYQEQLRAERS